MENTTELDKRLDAKNAELEKHLPEWYVILRKLVAEYLQARSPKNEDKSVTIAEPEKKPSAEARA